jgi:hypothetical protein
MSEQTVTFEQFQIYVRYRGDDDGFSRVATDEEKRAMVGVNWINITNLLQDLSIVRKGLVSAEFEADTLARVRAAGLASTIAASKFGKG